MSWVMDNALIAPAGAWKKIYHNGQEIAYVRTEHAEGVFEYLTNLNPDPPARKDA